MARARKKLPESLPITKARQQLCPLVEELAKSSDGKIAITVGEEVAAYLVSPAQGMRLHRSGPRPSLEGSLLPGEVEVDDPSMDGYAHRETMKHLEAEWKEWEEDGLL